MRSYARAEGEVEQHLTINNEGRVWFSGYNFGCGGERYEKARSKNFKIDKDATDKLFDAIAAYFGNEYNGSFRYRYWRLGDGTDQFRGNERTNSVARCVPTLTMRASIYPTSSVILWVWMICMCLMETANRM